MKSLLTECVLSYSPKVRALNSQPICYRVRKAASMWRRAGEGLRESWSQSTPTLPHPGAGLFPPWPALTSAHCWDETFYDAPSDKDPRSSPSITESEGSLKTVLAPRVTGCGVKSSAHHSRAPLCGRPWGGGGGSCWGCGQCPPHALGVSCSTSA